MVKITEEDILNDRIQQYIEKNLKQLSTVNWWEYLFGIFLISPAVLRECKDLGAQLAYIIGSIVSRAILIIFLPQIIQSWVLFLSGGL